MKTALQHFNELPQPYGQMAIEETIRQGQKTMLDEVYSDVCCALSASFIWINSKAGHQTWMSIHDNLQHLESQSKQDKG